MTAWDIIKANMARAGIKSIKELSKETGISYATLTQKRIPDPGSFKRYELGSIIDVTNMPDADIAAMMRIT